MRAAVPARPRGNGKGTRDFSEGAVPRGEEGVKRSYEGGQNAPASSSRTTAVPGTEGQGDGRCPVSRETRGSRRGRPLELGL